MSAPLKISATPFAKILPWIVAGIVIANGLPALAWYYPAAAFLLCGIVAWAWRAKDPSWIYTGATLLFFAMTVTQLTATREVMPHGPRLVMTLRIDSKPVESGRWLRADASVDKFRLCDSGAEEAEWLKSGEKAVIRFDTAHRATAGDRMIITGRAGDLGTEEYAGYVRLMKRRGYSATVWVNAGDEIITLPGKARTPRIAAGRMQSAAIERLGRLRMDGGAMTVAQAMTAGSRSGFDPALRDNYSLTGASHLLAVSGLHVGIVAMLINMLLWLLPLAHRGHIAKNIIAIAVIWLYAFVTGLSPSVLRAAMMFTGAQFALASSRKGAGINIMLGTASVMLLINPNYLYDVSFQLSFAAVFGIFMFFEPLYGLARTRFRAANLLWSAFIIGFAATLVTAPLVSYYFGRIPVIGLLMNPLVVLTAHITVLFSLLWIIAPIGFLNGAFSTIIGFSAGLQNDVVGFCAAKSWASVPVQLSAWQAVLVYIVIFTLWWLLNYRRGQKEGKSGLE